MELDWQIRYRCGRERQQYLLKNKIWTDCNFLVGTSQNQRLISAHKIFLAAASPVFECMFFGDLSEKTNPIVIPDIEPYIFNALLEYIYSDNIAISSSDMACDLIYAAKKYMLSKPVDECITYLRENINPTNACRIYEIAKISDEQDLMRSSIEFISNNTSKVLKDPNFRYVEFSTLMAILDLDELNIVSELDLFNVLLDYAKERGFSTEDVDIIKVNKTEDATVDKPIDLANPMSTEQELPQVEEAFLRKCIKKIRFLTLSPEEFAESPARSNILKPQESLAILINLNNPGRNDYPMPEGFCSSRKRRASMRKGFCSSRKHSTGVVAYTKAYIQIMKI